MEKRQTIADLYGARDEEARQTTTELYGGYDANSDVRQTLDQRQIKYVFDNFGGEINSLYSGMASNDMSLNSWDDYKNISEKQNTAKAYKIKQSDLVSKLELLKGYVDNDSYEQYKTSLTGIGENLDNFDRFALDIRNQTSNPQDAQNFIIKNIVGENAFKYYNETKSERNSFAPSQSVQGVPNSILSPNKVDIKEKYKTIDDLHKLNDSDIRNIMPDERKHLNDLFKQAERAAKDGYYLSLTKEQLEAKESESRTSKKIDEALYFKGLKEAKIRQDIESKIGNDFETNSKYDKAKWKKLDYNPNIEHVGKDIQKVISYFVNKGDYDTANEYVETIKQGVKEAIGINKALKLSDNPLGRVAFNAYAGLSNFGEGLWSTANAAFGNVLDTSPTQIATQQLKELSNASSIDAFINDAIYTTFNMLPTVGAAIATGGTSLGTSVALGGMGVSAFGNTYKETYHSGHDKMTSFLYAGTSAAAEVVTEKYLGGFEALQSTGVFKKLASKDFAASLKTKPAQLFISALDEGFEEYVQANMEPIFRNTILGEDNKFNPFSSDKFYAAALGMVTSAGLNTATGGVNRVVNNIKGINVVKSGAVSDVINLGLKFDENTKPYKLAKNLTLSDNVKYGEIAELQQSVRSQISGEVYEQLRGQMHDTTASDLTKTIVKVINNEAVTEAEANTIEKSPIAKEVIESNQASTETLNNTKKALADSILSDITSQEYDVDTNLEIEKTPPLNNFTQEPIRVPQQAQNTSNNAVEVNPNSEVNYELTQTDNYSKADSFWEAKNKNETKEQKGVREKISSLLKKDSSDINSLSEIRKEIETLFDVPVSKGKFRDKAYGIYKVKSEAIRTKITNAMPTIAHELGHHLDKSHGLQRLSTISEAIKVLKDTRPDYYKSYTKKEITGEAVAEFMRDYITDKTLTELKYPKFYKEVINTLSEENLKKLNTIADMTNKYMASTKRERAKASIISREKAQRINKISFDLKGKVEKAVMLLQDEALPLKKFDKAYDLFYYAKKSNSRVYNTIDGYYMTSSNGDIVYRRNEKGEFIKDSNGNKVPETSLKYVFEDVKSTQEYNDLSLYLVYKHALEWISTNKRVFADDSLNNPEFINKEIAELAEKYPHFEKTANKVYEWQRTFMYEWLVNTGIITADTFKTLNETYPNYVPFYRNVDNDAKGAKSSLSSQRSPIKRAKGSGLEILNPIENIAINIDKYIKIADRNAVMKAVAKAAESGEGLGYLIERITPSATPTSVSSESVKKTINEILKESSADEGLLTSISEAIDESLGGKITEWMVKDNQGRDIVWVLEGGKKKFYQVHNKDLLSALSGMDKQQVDVITKMAGSITRAFKVLTTGGNALWSLTSNTVRDFDSAYKYSIEKNLFKFTKGYIQSMHNIVTKSEYYKKYKTAGGGYNNAISTNPKALNTALRGLVNQNKTTIQKAWEQILHPLEAIEGLADIIETAPRAAEFNRVYDKTNNAMEALKAADEITVNFNRSGSLGKRIDAYVPYFNAALQGTAKVVSELKHNPVKFAQKSLTMAVVTTAITFAMLNLFGEDDEYEKLSAYLKNNYYNIKIPGLKKGEFISIAKSQDTAVFNSLIERMVEIAIKEDKDFAKEFADFADYVLSTFLPPGVPTPQNPDAPLTDLIVFGTGMELGKNENFTGSPIEPEYMQDFEVQDRYNERTTWIAKQLGGLLGFSPFQWDHIINSNTGVIGQINKALGIEDKDYSLGVKNKFLRDNVYSNDTFNEFYNNLDKYRQAKNSNPENGELVEKYQQYNAMSGIASALNAYGKEDVEEARAYKETLLEYINDFMKNEESDKKLIELFERTQDNDVFPYKSISPNYSVDKTKYKMPADVYLEYVDEYNDKLSEMYDEVLESKHDDEIVLLMLKDAKKEVAALVDKKYKTKGEKIAAEATNDDWKASAFRNIYKSSSKKPVESRGEYSRALIEIIQKNNK